MLVLRSPADLPMEGNMGLMRAFVVTLVLAASACDLPPEEVATPAASESPAVSTADAGTQQDGDGKPRRPVCCRDTKAPSPDGGK